MDVEVITTDETFKFSDYDVIPLGFRVSSPPILSSYQTVDGRDGVVDYGASLGQRNISVPFYVKARDQHDFPLLRDKLFSLTSRKESFYIREIRRSGNKDAYIGGKRYLVRLQNEYQINQNNEINLLGQGDLIFETTDLPYAESIGTTQDIEQNGIDSESELWGYGMGLLDDPDSHKYTFTDASSFSLYNAGIGIHPFQQELKITINSIVGSHSTFELENTTNGSLFQVNELASGTIILDGPNVTRNGLQYLRKTNKEFVELSPGWNDFVLRGPSYATFQFDFRYYYL